MLSYLTSSGLMPSLQSAYRVHHSTESAVLRVMAHILQALDHGDFAALAFLDLSAAFDTVDHAILLRRTELSYGIRGLGVWIGNGLTMSTHITKVVAGCFASLRQLRSVRRSLSHESFTRLVVALVLARLDYCNGVLAGLPASNSNSNSNNQIYIAPYASYRGAEEHQST